MRTSTEPAQLPTGPSAPNSAVAGGCDAKIRPFPNPTELTCEKADPQPHDEHFAVLRDYAYPGSNTVLTWQESDRRTFRGVWRDCGLSSTCILPAGHLGRHA